MWGSMTATNQPPRILRNTTPPAENSRSIGLLRGTVSLADSERADNRRNRWGQLERDDFQSRDHSEVPNVEGSHVETQIQSSYPYGQVLEGERDSLRGLPALNAPDMSSDLQSYGVSRDVSTQRLNESKTTSARRIVGCTVRPVHQFSDSGD